MDKKEILFEDIIREDALPNERFEELIHKKYWGYMMGVAKRYINDRNTAKEIVNDSFLKAFRGISKFRGGVTSEDLEKTFKAWLARVTVNTAIDHLRATKSIVYIDDLIDHDSHLAVEIDHRLHVQDIMELLFTLPDLHRSVFNLYELDGFSHQEIADMLGIPASSSRVYLTKAKQRLRVLYTIDLERNDG